MYKTDPTKGSTHELRTQSPNAVETRNTEPQRENTRDGKRKDVPRDDRIGIERSRSDATERNRSGTGHHAALETSGRHGGGQTMRDDPFKAHSTPAPAIDARKSLPKRLRNVPKSKHGEATRDEDRINTKENGDPHWGTIESGGGNVRRDRRARENGETRERLMSKLDSHIRHHDRHHAKHEVRHDASPTEKARTLCVNNKHDPRLRDRRYKLGTSAQCISKGFGSALYQHVEDRREFIKKFDAPYEKIINLDSILWYKNSEPPAGRHRATLPMCFQKGFGAGSAALAKKSKARA